jgi:MoxR-like ATPase
MIDDALLRRFDLSLQFDKPGLAQTKDLIDLTLKNGQFKFDKVKTANEIIKDAIGLSYYSIQKTLITAIKQSLFKHKINCKIL